MRAVIITRPGDSKVLEIHELPTPEPVADQVLVRVRAAGLNRADIGQREGNYPAPAGSPAHIPGLEFAGEVAAVGPLVTKWKLGQRVMGIIGSGGQAEFLLSHEGMLVEIPANLDYIQAAAIPEVFMTAHDALFTQGGLQMGERVLIHAVGSGVGTAAVQLAHAVGATTYGTSRTQKKLEQAKPLGLTMGMTDANFAQEVAQATNGEGVHMVLDVVGAPYMEQNINALTTWGRMVFLATMGGKQANVDLLKVMMKRLTIRGCTLRSRTLDEKMTVTRRFATQVVPLFAHGSVQPIVEEIYPLHEIAHAHDVMEENKNFGKLILRID
jgi:putative PIG3 family NAD(P)H quinone oxidoreductase